VVWVGNKVDLKTFAGRPSSGRRVNLDSPEGGINKGVKDLLVGREHSLRVMSQFGLVHAMRSKTYLVHQYDSEVGRVCGNSRPRDSVLTASGETSRVGGRRHGDGERRRGESDERENSAHID
jgi:hypothetical protein